MNCNNKNIVRTPFPSKWETFVVLLPLSSNMKEESLCSLIVEVLSFLNIVEALQVSKRAVLHFRAVLTQFGDVSRILCKYPYWFHVWRAAFPFFFHLREPSVYLRNTSAAGMCVHGWVVHADCPSLQCKGRSILGRCQQKSRE